VGTRYETCNGQPFFRGSVSSTDGGISCIVASDAQLDLLSTIVQNCMSMPHKTVPRQFYQLFTIFVTRQDFVFPVCFILMTRKTKELYVTSFRRLHELIPNFQPSRVMADNEDGFIVALKEVYGQNIHVEGCSFHFSQAVVRKAKKIGLSGAFRDDEHTRKCIRCLTCLPLLPADDS